MFPTIAKVADVRDVALVHSKAIQVDEAKAQSIPLQNETTGRRVCSNVCLKVYSQRLKVTTAEAKLPIPMQEHSLDSSSGQSSSREGYVLSG